MPKLYHPNLKSFTPADGEEIKRAKDGSFDVPEEFVPLAVETFGMTAEKPAKAAG